MKRSPAKIIAFPAAAPAPEKEERIKRRKDGLYQVELRYVLPDGTKKKRSFYGATQKEALSKRRSFVNELESGVNISKSDIKVSDYAESWLRIYKANVKPNTLGAYRHDVNLLNGHCGGKRIRDVSLSDVQEVLNSRSGLSKSAVKKTSMTLKAIFEAARADRIIAFNPCDKLVLPDAEDGTHRVITDDERDLITSANKDHRFHLAAMLMLYAGLRRGEVMALNLSRDVDLVAKKIHIVEAIHFEGNKAVLGPPKSKASVRTVPIFAPLLPLLQQHAGEGLVVFGSNGRHLTETAFKRVLKSYLYSMEVVINGVSKRWANDKQKASWKPFLVRCHDLRHTFCSMLYDAGVDVKTAQAWMGHADILVTMRIYTHLSNAKHQKATEAADKHFRKIVGKSVGKKIETSPKT